MMKRTLQAALFTAFFANFSPISTAYAAPSIPQDLLTDSLVYCTSVSGFSFNPQKADVGSNMNVVTEQIYDKLIELDPQTNRLKPALAERFEVSEDGLTITFYLRKNVRFHETKWFTPSRKFNAEDVLFSLNRVIGKESNELSGLDQEQSNKQSELAKRLAARTHFPFFESIDLKSKIESISAVSPYVVQIRLNRPDASFLAHLASQFAVILSKEYALQLNADDNLPQLDLLPVGTGVYQLENYVQNEFVRLTANPDYWGKKAQISRMIVDFSTTPTGRMAKFLNGECDVSAFPEPSQLSRLNPEKGYIVEQKGANLAYLAFNFERPIGQNLALRQQIAQAIDRERLARLFFYGVAEVAQNVLPSALFPYANPNGYPYKRPANPEKPQSTPLLLWVIDEPRVYHQHPLKMAEFVRAELERAGIAVTVRSVSRAYLTQQLEQGSANYDLILSGWTANNFDPDSFLSPMLECQAQHSVTNLANWCDLTFDTLLANARLSEESQAREQLYQQAQRYLQQTLPLLPLVNVHRLLLANHDVQQVKISPFGQVKLSEMRLK